jgi:hypothetical protein
MLSAFSKMRRSRVTAISFAVIAGVVLLVILYSVQPTASRFDASTRSLGAAGLAISSVPGAPTGAILPVEPFFDYSLIFPEQPSPATP